VQIVDLFSGIGGFSLAGSWMGWRTVQFVEIDSYCQKILNKHWTNVPIYSNIKTFGIETLKKSNWNPSDDTIIVGGFP
jgi:DNA (cytosine-5)-methyltransferase 1